ncbi:MAG: putative transcriptional regulator [Paenibacillaceae bacterium]|jgi:predicted ArsR family transcriptional regulator|nr:putative transcriptional regulator [Paenibacillaceae bacterium]
MSYTLNQLPETRQSILFALKNKGPATIFELSGELSMTREAVRLQLMQLEGEGWVEKQTRRETGSSGGRPSMVYSITPKGEYLFPKHYDTLTVEVIDTVADRLGPEALREILAAMADSRVREWEPRLRGLDLDKRIEALKDIYLSEDAYMDVEKTKDGLCLIERNCPFFHVASRRPALCSVTVAVLTRLFGYRVERVKKFQDGDGRCAFHIRLDQPVDGDTYSFSLEEPQNGH